MGSRDKDQESIELDPLIEALGKFVKGFPYEGVNYEHIQQEINLIHRKLVDGEREGYADLVAFITLGLADKAERRDGEARSKLEELRAKIARKEITLNEIIGSITVDNINAVCGDVNNIINPNRFMPGGFYSDLKSVLYQSEILNNCEYIFPERTFGRAIRTSAQKSGANSSMPRMGVLDNATRSKLSRDIKSLVPSTITDRNFTVRNLDSMLKQLIRAKDLELVDELVGVLINEIAESKVSPEIVDKLGIGDKAQQARKSIVDSWLKELEGIEDIQSLAETAQQMLAQMVSGESNPKKKKELYFKGNYTELGVYFVEKLEEIAEDAPNLDEYNPISSNPENEVSSEILVSNPEDKEDVATPAKTVFSEHPIPSVPEDGDDPESTPPPVEKGLEDLPSAGFVSSVPEDGDDPESTPPPVEKGLEDLPSAGFVSSVPEYRDDPESTPPPLPEKPAEKSLDMQEDVAAREYHNLSEPDNLTKLKDEAWDKGEKKYNLENINDNQSLVDSAPDVVRQKDDINTSRLKSREEQLYSSKSKELVWESIKLREKIGQGREVVVPGNRPMKIPGQQGYKPASSHHKEENREAKRSKKNKSQTPNTIKYKKYNAINYRSRPNHYESDDEAPGEMLKISAMAAHVTYLTGRMKSEKREDDMTTGNSSSKVLNRTTTTPRNREGGNSFGSWLTFAFVAALLGTAARMGAAPSKSAGVVTSGNAQGVGSDLYGQATLPSLPEEVPSTFPTDTYWEVADKERGMLEPAWNLHGFLGVGLSGDRARDEYSTPAEQISQPIGISTPRDEHYPLEWDLDSFLGWSDSTDKVNASSDASITYSDALKPLNQPEYTPVIPQVKEEVIEQLELYLKEEGELNSAKYSALSEAVEEAKEGNYAKLGTALAHILKGKTVNPWGININNELYFVTSHFENGSEISLSLHNLLQNMNLVATGENSGVRLDDKDYLNFRVSLKGAFEQISTRGDRYPRDLIAIAMSICYNQDYTPRSEEEKAKLLDEYKEALKSFGEGHIQKQDDYKLFLAIADQAEMLSHFHGILPKKQQQEQVIVSEVAATPAPILEKTPGIGLDFAQSIVKEFLSENGISIEEIGEKALEVLKKSERYKKVEHLITSLHATGEDELSHTYKMFTYLEVLKEAVNAQKNLGYLETMGLGSLENSLKATLSELEDLRKGNYDKILWGSPKTNVLPGEDKTYQQQCPIMAHLRSDWVKFLSEEDKSRISALESSLKENWDTFNNDQKLSTVLLIQTIRRELSLFVYNDNRLIYTPWIKEGFGERIGDLLTRIEKVVENQEIVVEGAQQGNSNVSGESSAVRASSYLSESVFTIPELSEEQNVTTIKDSNRLKADEESGDSNNNNSSFYSWLNGLALAAGAVGTFTVGAFPPSEIKIASAADVSNSNAAESITANRDELEAQSTQEVPAVENVPAQDVEPGAPAVENIATTENTPETRDAQVETLESRTSDANQAADPSTQVGGSRTPEERAPEINNKSGANYSRHIGGVVGGSLGGIALGGLGYALATTFLVGAMSAFPPIAICIVAALALGAIGVASGGKAGDKVGSFIEQYRNGPSQDSPGR